MAPPFIAYAGMLQGGAQGRDLLKEAFLQCKLYRQYLSDESGLWKHIILGSWSDLHHWGTGASPVSFPLTAAEWRVGTGTDGRGRERVGRGGHAPRA